MQFTIKLTFVVFFCRLLLFGLPMAKAQLQYIPDRKVDKPLLTDFLGLPIGVRFNYLQAAGIQDIHRGLVAPEAVIEPAYYALKAMQEAAQADGLVLSALSSFRSQKTQQSIFRKYGEARAEKPGFSEHHIGTAIDFSGVTQNSYAFLWLLENGFAFGFVPTYYFRDPEDGFMKEPWHWRYVGRDQAKQFVLNWWADYQLEIARLRIAKTKVAGF